MFRQTIILVGLIAIATQTSAWFEVGTRVPGDQNIFNQTSQTTETDLPQRHTITKLFTGGEYTFTFSRFDVYEVRF